jgi:hypothetical protein
MELELMRNITIELLREIDSFGRTRNSKSISTELNTTQECVEETIININNDKIFIINKGRGGGLSISDKLIKNESDIYPRIQEALKQWVSDAIYGRHGVTGSLLIPTYSKKLSGKWSTPDFTIPCTHKFTHIPTSTIELVTIEVKFASSQFDVSCVYEALAHTRVSCYSILFFYVDPLYNIEDAGKESIFEEIKTECSRLGIGLVISEYPTDINNWSYIIPAKKNSPDPRRVDAYIDEAFDDEQKRWLKQHC